MICARELRIKVVAASFSSVFSISVGDRGDVFAVGPGMNRAGGLTNAREATPEIQHLADQVRGDLETKTKKTFKQYVAETYATQVVAGINYFIKVRVDNGEHIHLRVLKDLQQDVSLTSYQCSKTAMDPLVYF